MTVLICCPPYIKPITNLKNSIRTRLTTAFLGLAVWPLLIVGLLFVYKAYTVQIQDAIILQHEMASHLSSRVQSLILNLENQLKLIIRIKDLHFLEVEQQKLVLSVFHSQQSAIEDLYLLDTNGHVLSYHSRFKLHRDLTMQPKNDRALFNVPMSKGETYFGPVRFHELSGEPLMILSVPVINLETGKPEGVLVADVRLKEIWHLVASIRPGQKGDSYILDTDERIVAHSNPSVVLRGTKFHPPTFEGLQQGLNGQQSVLVSQMIQLGNQNFYIMIEEPASEALALSYETIRIIVLIIVLTLLVSGGIGFLLVRRMIRPIEEIAEAAQAINIGDLSRRVSVSSQDEIGVLATAFNSMTIQLETLINDLENRVAERTADLAASNKDLEAFAYSVSHDLRTPLRHIDGFLELLQQKIGSIIDSQARHYLDTISVSANKMSRLIDDLLTFSRMGRHVMSYRPVEMQSLVTDIIREFEPDTGNRDIHWSIADLPNIKGDAPMIRIVMTNLISNAIKFTRPRAKTVIEIGFLEQESEVTFFIRDNGVGFEMKYADKLFGVFQRLHRQDEFEGTGIGLANVHRIIKRHGGLIWVESEIEKGTTFYFTLPLNRRGGH